MKKSAVRAVSVLLFVLIAYFAGMYAETFTLVPLGNGMFEGTPATPVAFFSVFLLTLVVLFVIGNIFINRHFRLKAPK
jgi:hypothetical protein